jgi:hypothetical protein
MVGRNIASVSDAVEQAQQMWVRELGCALPVREESFGFSPTGANEFNGGLGLRIGRQICEENRRTIRSSQVLLERIAAIHGLSLPLFSEVHGSIGAHCCPHGEHCMLIAYKGML